MRQFLILLSIFLMVVWSAGCAQTSVCPEGQTLVEGACEAPPPPPPKTRNIRLACEWLPDGDNNPEPAFTSWELTVEPGPIIADQRFGVGFRGRAFFNETFLNEGMRILGGFNRVAFLDMRGTVHVRKGATGDDVELNPTPIEKSCTYDEEGNEAPATPQDADAGNRTHSSVTTVATLATLGDQQDQG
jgi:hypothetical protein